MRGQVGTPPLVIHCVGWYRGRSRRHQTARRVPLGVGRHQARTSNSPAATLSQRAADASPATTARCPLASTSRPNSPCSSSPKASTHRSCDAVGHERTRQPVGVLASGLQPGRQLDAAGQRDAGHTGIGHRRRQLQVAEVVDPGDLDPQTGAAVVQAALLDHAADQAHQRRRVDRLSQVLERDTGAQGGRGRGEEIAPVEGRAAVGWRRRARQLHDAGDRRLGRRLGGGDEQPVVGPDERQGRAGGQARPQSDAATRRADTGVDDGEHHAGAEVRHRPHQGVTARPDVEGGNVMRQVDDGRSRRARRNDRVHHAGELVLRAEVGEEEDGARGVPRHGPALSAACCGIVRWRRRPPP